MAVGLTFAYYHTTWGSGKTEDTENPEHKTARAVGKAIMALVILGGLLALYGLTASGMAGVGPMGHLSMKVNAAILGTLITIDGLTVIGLILKKCGFGSEKPPETTTQKTHSGSLNGESEN